MVLWQLFSTFLMIGFVSFGGGYAMIPVIHTEVVQHGWMTTQQFTDAIAIAGMSPGPIAANSAILVGYSTAGLAGAIISTLGVLFPAILIVVIVAKFFTRLNHYPIVQWMFYGLRPIVASLIIYAAISFTISNKLISLESVQQTLSFILIFGLSLFALIKLRWHPIFVILLSGLVGVAIYS